MPKSQVTKRGDSSVEYTDLGWERIQQEVAILSKRGVRVGVFGEDGKTSDDGTPVVEYAYYNEFGSQDGKRPPERSFIRKASDMHRGKWNKMQDRLWPLILSGKIKSWTALSLLGQRAQADIMALIQNYPGSNADSTIEAKNGRDTPLIDTRRLRDSIRYKVET